MNSKFFFLILIALTTSLGGYWLFLKQKGIDTEIVEARKMNVVPIELESISKSPFSFVWSNDDVILNEEWSNYIQEITSHDKSNERLMIVGPYYKSESNTTEYPNLGLARAHKMKELFIEHIEEDKIQISSRMIFENIEDAKEKDFPGQEYVSWVIFNEFVKQLDGKTLIYFPKNSSNEITTPEIVTYLDELAKQLTDQPDWTVQIVGHTDSEGDSMDNWNLGNDRANRIGELLLIKGIFKDRIQIISRGEEDPIASNETELGQQKNRRTEVIINR